MRATRGLDSRTRCTIWLWTSIELGVGPPVKIHGHLKANGQIRNSFSAEATTNEATNMHYNGLPTAGRRPFLQIVMRSCPEWFVVSGVSKHILDFRVYWLFLGLTMKQNPKNWFLVYSFFFPTVIGFRGILLRSHGSLRLGCEKIGRRRAVRLHACHC